MKPGRTRKKTLDLTAAGGRRQQETDSKSVFSSSEEILARFVCKMPSSSDETAASTLGALSAAGTLPHRLSCSQQQSFPELVFRSDWLPPAKTEKASRNVSPYHNIKQTAMKTRPQTGSEGGGNPAAAPPDVYCSSASDLRRSD